MTRAETTTALYHLYNYIPLTDAGGGEWFVSEVNHADGTVTVHNRTTEKTLDSLEGLDSCYSH